MNLDQLRDALERDKLIQDIETELSRRHNWAEQEQHWQANQQHWQSMQEHFKRMQIAWWITALLGISGLLVTLSLGILKLS